MSINKDKFYKRLALTTFFKVSNKVLDPEPIDKPIFINYDNWNDLKEQFFEQRMKSYDSSLSLAEKIKLETDYLNKLVSINQNERILKGKETDQFRILVDRYKNLLTENVDKLPIIKKEPEFDPKYFNPKGAELFEYLIENYIERKKSYGLKKRFTNVWHFMKNDNLKRESYNFRFTKNEYLTFIENRFKIKITNTDKSINKYENTDLPQLRDHVLNFEDSKKIE